MAKTKKLAKESVVRLTSWTRFHLPREQEWPTWSAGQAGGGHYGPLKGVKGCFMASLGRKVDDPEEAIYIIEWTTMEALESFQSSPACAEFLRGLPENNNESQVAVESGSALRRITLDDASSSTAPTSSRFLVFKHITSSPSSNVEEGRVVVTSFLVPQTVDDVTSMWKEHFYKPFQYFVPRGFEPVVATGSFLSKFSHEWFGVLSEDRWVEDMFGKLDDGQGRTIISHFHLWPWDRGATPETEAASAADPEAREAWDRVIAQVMPPATAWVQERWGIRFMPPPTKPEYDSGELSEFQKEKVGRLMSFREANDPKKDNMSN
ncbi:hypothetical protein COL154_009119 [Colletotrichum chrysophilum]|uniref:uncharacterized protein n=1 Tax=Colletotrichum chrysophilum TaxID=1836956 RepID=UPI0023012BA7|nr:uncharacterized protein COL26b_012536 [Colletotrichum chrysophilum]KAJ0358493.1 hypothetical protein COL154_009119 [Colletotrichum chrysophilum]KAJ0364422.1 hypothetical protein COL26b_012536 [Colletotrichum chrysophilum]